MTLYKTKRSSKVNQLNFRWSNTNQIAGTFQTVWGKVGRGFLHSQIKITCESSCFYVSFSICRTYFKTKRTLVILRLTPPELKDIRKIIHRTWWHLCSELLSFRLKTEESKHRLHLLLPISSPSHMPSFAWSALLNAPHQSPHLPHWFLLFRQCSGDTESGKSSQVPRIDHLILL